MAQSHLRRLRRKQDAVITSLANNHAGKPSSRDMSFCTVAWVYHKAGGGGVAFAHLRHLPPELLHNSVKDSIYCACAPSAKYHMALQAHIC